MKTLKLGNNVEWRGRYSFGFSYALNSVTLGNKLIRIGAFSFKDCTKIKSITIPATVTYIENSAFEKATGLRTIYFKGTTEPQCGGNAFYQVPSTVYVPSGYSSSDFCGEPIKKQ